MKVEINKKGQVVITVSKKQMGTILAAFDSVSEMVAQTGSKEYTDVVRLEPRLFRAFGIACANEFGVDIDLDEEKQ